MLRDEYNTVARSTERPTLHVLPNAAINLVAHVSCVDVGPPTFHTCQISWKHVAGKHRGHVSYAFKRDWIRQCEENILEFLPKRHSLFSPCH